MQDGAPPRWTVPGWGSIPGLTHGFFGRAGGASSEPFDSLNCSTRIGDDAAAVRLNRDLVAASLGCERLALPAQVHGDRIDTATSSYEGSEADGLIVGGSSLAAGVLTADCVPLLLVVPRMRLAAAIHAGWKGTALGIAAGAVAKLATVSGLPPSAIHAALGPSIGGCCYEVGAEVVDAIEAGAGRGLVRAARRHGSKTWIDLRAINTAILARSGVDPDRIFSVGPCTRCALSECFSHRGSGGRTGRQVSAVGWT